MTPRTSGVPALRQLPNRQGIFALRPEARSRLNTGYMTCAFLGGSAGSWLGAHAFAALGWGAVCGLVAIAACLASAGCLTGRPRRPGDRTGQPQPTGTAR